MDKAKDESINKLITSKEKFGKETTEFINSLSGLTPNQRIMAIANKLLEETLSLEKILLRIEKDIRICKFSR